MEQLRVGVIGVGWFGTVHCRAIADHPQLELAALCDASEDRLAEMAREHGVARTCTDYRELVDDPEIDALAVVTPWDHHATPTLAGLAAGKHVLVEKPMASTVEDCQRMCDAARDAEAILMVGHICRFNPRYASAKREIDAGRIGKVVAINARRNVPAQWVIDQLDSISPILHTCSHDTDMMLWLTGAKVVSTYAQTVNTLGRAYDDMAQLMYRFDSGATAIYEGAWCMPDTSPFELDERMSVIGTEGFHPHPGHLPQYRRLLERGLQDSGHDLLARAARHHRRRAARRMVLLRALRPRGDTACADHAGGGDGGRADRAGRP